MFLFLVLKIFVKLFKARGYHLEIKLAITIQKNFSYKQLAIYELNFGFSSPSDMSSRIIKRKEKGITYY